MTLTFLVASLLGCLTGALALGALRCPPLAWFALMPLGYVTATRGPVEAGVAAALAGAIFGTSGQTSAPVRRLLPVSALGLAVPFALCFAVAGYLWPDDQWGWAPVVLPVATVVAVVPLRRLGAPRYVSNLLARSQEGWPAALYVSRLGSDLWLLAVIAFASGSCLALSAPSGWSAGAVGLLLVLGTLAWGAHGSRKAALLGDLTASLRVACVVADGSGAPFDLEHPDRAFATVVARYAPLIEKAAVGGAALVVLPEVAVCLDEGSHPHWERTAGAWAQRYGITVVAPFFDRDAQLNGLVVAGPGGEVLGRYEKQHPGPIEPPCREAMGPLTFPVGHHIATAVICVDLDYGDLVAVAAESDLLVVPANDWPGFAEVHHRTAVWSPVMAGVALVRATGHGVSSCIDAAGRTLVRTPSNPGPVVLIADVPLPRRSA